MCKKNSYSAVIECGNMLQYNHIDLKIHQLPKTRQKFNVYCKFKMYFIT